MTGQLPPSKFGKGFTYGGADQSQPNTGAVPPPPPSHGAAHSPTFGAGDQYPADPTNTVPAPSPDPGGYDATAAHHATPSPAASPWASAPTPGPTRNAGSAQWSGAAGSAGAFLKAGAGAPKAAAVLSIIGGLWAAVTVAQRWDQIKAMFKFAKYASHLPAGSGWYYMTLIATIVEIIAIPMLLAAGAMMLQRNRNSLRAVTLGNAGVIAANLVLAVAINKATNTLTSAVSGLTRRMDSIAGRLHINSSRVDSYASGISDRISSASAEFIVFHLVLPALLAVVAIVLARSVASRLWLQGTTGYGS